MRANEVRSWHCWFSGTWQMQIFSANSRRMNTTMNNHSPTHLKFHKLCKFAQLGLLLFAMYFVVIFITFFTLLIRADMQYILYEFQVHSIVVCLHVFWPLSAVAHHRRFHFIQLSWTRVFSVSLRKFHPFLLHAEYSQKVSLHSLHTWH